MIECLVNIIFFIHVSEIRNLEKHGKVHYSNIERNQLDLSNCLVSAINVFARRNTLTQKHRVRAETLRQACLCNTEYGIHTWLPG